MKFFCLFWVCCYWSFAVFGQTADTLVIAKELDLQQCLPKFYYQKPLKKIVIPDSIENLLPYLKPLSKAETKHLALVTTWFDTTFTDIEAYFYSFQQETNTYKAVTFLVVDRESWWSYYILIINYLFPYFIYNTSFLLQSPMKHQKLLFICCLLLIACGNQTPTPTNQQIPALPFGERQQQGVASSPALSEASGLAPSLQNRQYLWTHNDSGGEAALFLMGGDGKELAKLPLPNFQNRDWEDMATALHQNTPYLYVADIGDNNATYPNYTIIKLKEPTLVNLTSLVAAAVQTITFQYADGSRDSETLLVDPQTQDIYIVSKRDAKSRLYVLRFPYQNPMNTAQFVAELPFSGAVGGSVSPSGNEVLIKNYGRVYYWKKKANETIATLLQQPPTELPYLAEPQGEAIAWKADESGYFTLSEKVGTNPQVLFFYKRN